MSEAPEDLRRKIFQDIRGLDERISVEEIDLLEKMQAMRELLKERRSTQVEAWTDTAVAGRGHSDGSSWVSKLRNGG